MVEQIDRRLLDVVEALNSSFDPGEVVTLAHDAIRELIPVDVAAICTSRPSGSPYDWFTTDCPPRFFEEYPSFAHADFVAEAVKRSPNAVVTDDAMAPRRTIETNVMYRRAHELGLPFRQAMAVLVGSGRDHGGITLYRTRRRPFDERERQTLAMFIRPLGHALVRCRRFREVGRACHALEACLAQAAGEVILTARDGRELLRSAGLTDTVGRWFGPVERTPSGQPYQLSDWVGEVTTNWPADRTSGTVHARERAGVGLRVRATALSLPGGERVIAFVFDEQAPVDPLPDGFARRLTPRQREVARGVLAHWDDELIATELGCAKGTVKKHVSAIFERCGVEDRLHFLALAHAMVERR